MKVNDFEVEEDISATATLFWAEGVWMNRWGKEQQNSWRTQIFEVQTGLQERSNP